jgi:CheY-like chemotaxis protein
MLLVEDAEDTLELLRRVFERRGYHVTACASAQAALSIAESERFDIIVSDIGLPHIDGYELLARLRRTHKGLRTVPAVALTGYAAAGDVSRAREAGYAAHVAKPVDPATLARVVEELLTSSA